MRIISSKKCAFEFLKVFENSKTKYKKMSREEKKEFYQNRARENRRLEKNRDLNAILKDVASEQPGYKLV